jgi:hypothetical protein
MKFQTKIAAIALTGATLAVSGTAYAATVASETGSNDRPSASAPSSAPDVVEAKLGDRRFAVVSATAAIDRSRNVITANRIAVGEYEVFFDRDVRECAYVAVIGQTDIGTALRGEITVASRAGEPNGVFVDTNDSNGVNSDRPFHLTVTC